MLKPSAVTFLKTLLDTPGPSGYEAAAAKPALEKPASVKAEDWAKMSDADKAKAVEKAKTAAPAKKEKKGGC